MCASAATVYDPASLCQAPPVGHAGAQTDGVPDVGQTVAGSERRRQMRLGTLICALALCAACAASRPDLQRLSADTIGCPPEAVTLRDAQLGDGMASWTAACDDKQYCCAAEDLFRMVSCVLKLY